MILKAKPVLKDKFWIVEQDEERIGTISLNDDRYMFSNQSETCFFDNKRQMKKKFGVDIIWTDITPSDTNHSKVNHTVHGFPTSVTPYNTMYDVKRKLPLYTKTNDSQSFFCAGYYCIQFDHGWVPASCPKLITLSRNNYLGPFKTKLEMTESLRQTNG